MLREWRKDDLKSVQRSEPVAAASHQEALFASLVIGRQPPGRPCRASPGGTPPQASIPNAAPAPQASPLTGFWLRRTSATRQSSQAALLRLHTLGDGACCCSPPWSCHLALPLVRLACFGHQSSTHYQPFFDISCHLLLTAYPSSSFYLFWEGALSFFDSPSSTAQRSQVPMTATER